MWNELKKNLGSAKVYLPEFILLNLIAIPSLFFVEYLGRHFILFYLLITLFSFMLLLIAGGRRRKEIDNITEIIRNIRNNVYNYPEEIEIESDMIPLQKEIREMFFKAKSDIEYLRRLEKVRTEFLGNVSHELRTPIFNIQGFIETLLDGAIDDPEVNRKFLLKANQNTKNLSILLNDLIDISRIQSGEMKMSFRYFSLGVFLQEILDEFSLSAEEKGLKLCLTGVNESLKAYGDKNKLRQVLNNLLQNALRYTEKGEITLGVVEENKNVRVFVRDTGIGIPEEYQNRIFERFFRVDKARSKEIGGSGLGLAISKHIIEAHGSSIEVKSKPGEGSEFSFRLKK